MTRKEAIDRAAEIVEKMGNVEDLNRRGYKIDGWKPMTGPERAACIVQIAEFLVGPAPLLVSPANPEAPEVTA
jgi:hypothetical protein